MGWIGILNFTEIVNPGQIVEEIMKSDNDSTNTGYSSVWYRYGNKLVKQARPWRNGGDASAYTLSREFTQDGMVSEFSTDNNNLKAVVFFKRL